MVRTFNIIMTLFNSAYQNYSNFLKQTFNFDKKKTKNNIVLVEFHGWCSAHICYSYLINSLEKKYNAQVQAFEGYTLISTKIKQSFLNDLKWNIATKLKLKNFKTYKALGSKKFIRAEKNKSIEARSKKIFDKADLSSKQKIIDFKINGIKIGDLIYDTYLKNEKIPTINVKSQKFRNFFLESINLFFFWIDYFKANNVKAVIISHSTYIYGIIMRIACSLSVQVFKPTFNTIYRITRKNYTIGDEFFQFRKIFKKIPKKIKNHGLNKVKNDLSKMFKGKKNFALGYNTKKNKKFSKLNNKIGVLIAMHNFYDSPHVFGNLLFPDFFEWLKHILLLSKKTNYNWYLRLHPENSSKDVKFISELIKHNDKIKIISHKTNHNQIINMGIKFALTCFGSIAYEYAYRGITVINACLRNPHIAYRFNHNPKTIKQFNKLIMNLEKFKLKPNKNHVIEFLYVRRYYLRHNWLKLNRGMISKGFGWQNKIYRPQMYNLWIKNFNEKKHFKIIKTVNNFINSKNYKLQSTHINK